MSVRRTIGGAVAAAALGTAAVAAPAASADPSFSVSVGSPPALGPFVPGESADYSTTAVATVLSSAATAVLTIQDVGAGGTPGTLLNAAAGASLPQPLQVSAASTAAGATGTPFGPLSSAVRTLVTYDAPVMTPDNVAIGFRQHIAATDPLRSGTYATSLLVTLATTVP